MGRPGDHHQTGRPRAGAAIGCDILGTDGEGNHGYKDECESVGPCHYSCPLKFLRMVPEVAREGRRQKVREFHARTGQKIVAGQKLNLAGAGVPYVAVTGVRPLKGTHLGTTYRIPRRFLAPPDEQETAHEPKPVAGDARDKQTTLFAA